MICCKACFRIWINTTNGMRKALKEGRWVSTAPMGYKNSRDAFNKPILVKSEVAELIKKSFERFATGTYQIDELKRAESGFEEYCRYGISLLSNLPYYYSNASLEGKQKMLGLIFPEKLVFESGKYRTATQMKY